MADDNDPIEHLRTLTDADRVVMVATAAPRGLDARPLTVLEVDDNGACWFLVSRAADWVPALADNDEAIVTGSNPSDGSWFSATGRATVVDDVERARALWNLAANAWFEGPDDPDLVALKVEPETLSTWETPSNRLVHLVQIAKAVVTHDANDTGTRQVEAIPPT
jgi:general stress protein 26